MYPNVKNIIKPATIYTEKVVFFRLCGFAKAFLSLDKMEKTMKKFIMWLIIPILIGLFNISLLLYPREVIDAARGGLLLWFQTVLPSLLPFVVGMNLLIKLGFLRFIGEVISPVTMKIFGVPGAGGVALITGITSGYPIGAKTVGDLCRAGDVKPEDAQRLLAFCNNAGPLFIVGAVGIGMFGDAKAGYILWAGHVLGALAVGIINRIICKKMGGEASNSNILYTATRNYRRFRQENECSMGKILGESVKNAMESLLLVGGLIIFFSVVVCILQWPGALSGLFEITGGARAISSQGANTAALAMAAGVIGFGGFSVHAQALHFTAGTGVKAVPYLLWKALHGLLAAGFTALLWSGNIV
jgi:nucleoside recognition membrane protein YjiH